MLKVKFYISNHEIVREQEAAQKGVYTHTLHCNLVLAGSQAELIQLKHQLLQEESQNALKTAAARSSVEYYEAKDEAKRINKLQNGGYLVCEYCNNICEEDKLSVLRYTVDHVIPLSEGGDGASLANLKIACRFCNRLKGSHSEATYLKMVKSGQREKILEKFNEYLLENNLTATHEVLSNFIKKYDKISKQKKCELL